MLTFLRDIVMIIKIIIEFGAKNIFKKHFCVLIIYAFKNKFSQNTQIQ